MVERGSENADRGDDHAQGRQFQIVHGMATGTDHGRAACALEMPGNQGDNWFCRDFEQLLRADRVVFQEGVGKNDEGAKGDRRGTQSVQKDRFPHTDIRFEQRDQPGCKLNRVIKADQIPHFHPQTLEEISNEN